MVSSHVLPLHQFYLMGSGLPNDGPYDPATSAPLAQNHALTRDTATVNAGSYMVFNWVADKPGVW